MAKPGTEGGLAISLPTTWRIILPSSSARENRSADRGGGRLGAWTAGGQGSRNRVPRPEPEGGPVRQHAHSRSTTIAKPVPPAAQTVINP
jgi:hypothetical protein